MDYGWIDTAALKHPGTEKDYKAEWEAYRYLVGSKMFGMLGQHKDGRPILTVKLPPAEGDTLRQQYKDIIPGYYMNKTHWNSVYLDGAVPQNMVADMLEKSYQLIFSGLSKKAQKEITG